MKNSRTDTLALRIATILRQQGPTNDLQLARQLMDEGQDVDEHRFDRAISAAGAVSVRSGDDTLLAMPAPIRRDRNRAEATIQGLAPHWLLAIVIVVVILTSVLMASVNKGLKGAPTLKYTPPIEAKQGG